MLDPEGAKERRAMGTAQLLEQLARRILEKRHRHDLHASQWSALRYFGRSGRRTCNVIGLSKYLGNTSGSTSRTAKSLVERSFLAVEKAEHDARSVTFNLTEAGKDALSDDPLRELSKLLEDMPAEDLVRLSEVLEDIYSRLTQSRET